jgi:hypothetical protein
VALSQQRNVGAHFQSRPTLPLALPCPQTIVEKEGLQGLFFRGLGTKLITNGIQGIMFSVLWRLGQDYMAKQEKDKQEAQDAKAKKK